jgi:hypothetical protein
LSYYRLGNDAFGAIIPALERDYLLSIRVLDCSYNSLNDAGLEPLIQSLASLGSPIEELNISGNNLSDGICKLISDKIKEGKTKYLAKIVLEDCPKVTDEGKRCIKLATMKAQSNKGNETLNTMVKTANERDRMASEGQF